VVLSESRRGPMIQYACGGWTADHDAPCLQLLGRDTVRKVPKSSQKVRLQLWRGQPQTAKRPRASWSAVQCSNKSSLKFSARRTVPRSDLVMPALHIPDLIFSKAFTTATQAVLKKFLKVRRSSESHSTAGRLSVTPWVQSKPPRYY